MSSTDRQPPQPPPRPSELELEGHDLPPEVFRRVLSSLPLFSRSNLRRCSKHLRRAVLTFDRSLLPPSASSGATVSAVGDDDEDDEAETSTTAALRRELIDEVEDRRWLPRKLLPQEQRRADGPAPALVAEPGESHLRRLTKGDFLAEPEDYDSHSYSSYDSESAPKYKRQNRFYSDACLVDDHIWILYSSYWYSFEAFDLNTGKHIEFSGSANGPEKYYINDDDECIHVALTTYAGCHGLLAAGLNLTVQQEHNPHGAWSGPYITVWNIATDETRMSIDLYRPMMHIVDVCILSPVRVAILLAGIDGVELQWHRIPINSSEMGTTCKDDPPVPQPDLPGEEPPSHQCSLRCPAFAPCPHRLRFAVWKSRKDFWEEQERDGGEDKAQEELSKRRSNDDDVEEEDGDSTRKNTNSYNSRREYRWWPGKMTLIQTDNLRDKPLEDYNTATMQSDAGMVVVVVADRIQVWHVGTMTLIRECRPFDHDVLTFHGGISVKNLTVKTVVRPIEDVKGPGEGRYYRSGEEKCPSLEPYRRFIDSRNPIDLSQCDANTILARFAHLTYDEQRSFERGTCGRGSSGHSIHRIGILKEGSCSPQLDCIVRVAFCVHNKGSTMNWIVHMDINAFHHIRHRESYDVSAEGDYMEEVLEQYERVCLGNDSLWRSTWTHYVPEEGAGGDSFHIFDWERGGMFDFENGPCDKTRMDKCNSLMENVGDEGWERLDKLYGDVYAAISRWRCPTSLYIDSYKLIVCTLFEVAVMPLSLALPGVGISLQEKWQDNEVEHGMYLCRSDTKMWHSYRPLDDSLVSRWNNIRSLASFRQSREGNHKVLREKDRHNDLKSITADMNESLETELSLLETARYESAKMSPICISWRYLAIVGPSLEDSEGHEILHVFDALSDWIRASGTPLLASENDNTSDALAAKEPGVQFEEYESSSDDEQ